MTLLTQMMNESDYLIGGRAIGQWKQRKAMIHGTAYVNRIGTGPVSQTSVGMF